MIAYRYRLFLKLLLKSELPINHVADSPHISKISNHPPHILAGNNGTLSPSSFIPFCSFAGNWNITGAYTDKLNTTVCNIFKETMVDGQLCYKADVDRFSDKVLDKKKIVTEGLVILLDYNKNRMVEVGGDPYLTSLKGQCNLKNSFDTL